MTHEEALAFIDDQIKKNDIVVFMKGTADFPMCGFSGRVVQIFNHFKRPFAAVNVLEDEAVRNAIKSYSNWPTIPQIYIKGEFIGGCDITSEMAQTGELEKMMNEKLGALS
ncbi:MAG: Grx4 family monothiol glutaredoxin [Bdellovibrionales bacterium]|nr:Grx4 family monothiol glutaredoxin [Bdellovibrionales bacterium]